MKTILTYCMLVLCCIGGSFAQEKWTLEACIAHAKENSMEAVRQRQENLKLASDVKASKGSYFPSLSFSASQGYSLGNSFNVSTGVGQLNSRYNSFNLSSSMDLFKGFQNKYKAHIAKLNRDKGAVDTEKIGFEISQTIVSKYLEVLMNKEIVTLAEHQVEISAVEVERLKKLFELGLKSKSEYLEMKATHDSDQKELQTALNRDINGLLELQNLLDVKAIKNFDIATIDLTDKDDMIILSSVDSIYNAAVNNNPVIQSTVLTSEIAEKNIRMAKSSFFPSISFSYGVGSNYYHIQGSEDVVFNPATNTFRENGFFTQLDNNLTHGVGISANIPIFNKLNTRASVEKAKIDFATAEIELENQKKELANKIEIAYNDMLSAKSAITAAQSAALAQEEAFSINQRKYKNGLVTNYEFLESKRKLIQTQSELIRAKYEYLFKMKLLELYQN